MAPLTSRRAIDRAPRAVLETRRMRSPWNVPSLRGASSEYYLESIIAFADDTLPGRY